MKKFSVRWRLGLAMPLLALLLAGCVTGDMRESISQGGAGSGLSAEQRTHLRLAAKSGEPELLATASRMAWDYPEQKAAIAAYAQELMPQ